jgi:hypothetical protein
MRIISKSVNDEWSNKQIHGWILVIPGRLEHIDVERFDKIGKALR